MTSHTLKRWELRHRQTYIDLAEHCGSIPELFLKTEIYGQKWTKWDWVLFFNYLVCQVNASRFTMNSRSDNGIREKTLLDDIFDTLDLGNSLDGVFTDKTVIMNFISYPEIMDTFDIVNPQPFIFVFVEIFSLLAHVFKKFPSMWKMKPNALKNMDY
jgi:hypothetical protein